MTLRFRPVLAISAVFLAAALLLRRKYAASVNRTSDHDVEDFTANQEAVLRRVREIWADHCTA
jgi:hypothetical protein